MTLTKYSRNRLLGTMEYWRVEREYARSMYDYLVYGFEPGGFFKGWYANDAMAILHSHHSNSVESLKNLTKWMINCMPSKAWGSHAKVDKWLALSNAERRTHLEEYNLIFTEAQEIEMALKGEPTREPTFVW